jgi:putative hydrolase of the HAD superfamily
MVDHILFDLDNTLYSPRSGLEAGVSRRIHEYIAAWLGLSVEEAVAERKQRIDNYGTTLEWLMAEKGFTAIEDYYRAVHPDDEADALLPDPELRDFLKNLPRPLSILTNAPREHAGRILEKLGIAGLFGEIFDIRRLGYRGKPREEAFRVVLGVLGAEPEEVLFIDDVPKYVLGYRAIGGRGLLIDELDEHLAYPHEKIRNIRELTRFLD